MAELSTNFEPDYAVPPGWILEERLEAIGMSQADFARRCGRSPKLISEIIAGKAPVEPKTAVEFEAVLGVDARIWLGIEGDYRLQKAKEAAAEERKRHIEWVRNFPVKHLIERGLIEKSKDEAKIVEQILVFFSVATQTAWKEKFSATRVAYRHSPSFSSSEECLATWLRIGELEAKKQDTLPYDENAFRKALFEVRGLTRRCDMDYVVPEMTTLCNKSGVAIVFSKALPKTSLSGAARWLNSKKALIQLSLRHKSDDHLWFSFFHEAAHILLHQKNAVFVDGSESREGIEQEADQWARSFLVDKNEWRCFVEDGSFNEANIRDFALRQGIASGIVIGMLQHDKHLPWGTYLNKLKCRYEWKK